jgi:type I restriction-modification system DNA methylase subunit
MGDDTPGQPVAHGLRAADEALRDTLLHADERRLLTLGLLFLAYHTDAPSQSAEAPARGVASGVFRTRPRSSALSAAAESSRELVPALMDLVRAHSGIQELVGALGLIGDLLERVRKVPSRSGLLEAVRIVDHLPAASAGDRRTMAAGVDLYLSEFADANHDASTLPREVAELMVRLAEPRIGDRILDPCCGTGGLLVRAAELAREGTVGGAGPELFGQDASPVNYAAAQLVLWLHGLPLANLRVGDALQAPAFLEQDGHSLERFDRVVSAPPLSASWRGGTGDLWNRFLYGVPPRHSADTAYLQHILASVREGGRAVVLTPPGVLFRSGEEGKIRQRMLEAGHFEAVVALPRRVLSGTALGPVLLVLRRPEPSRSPGAVQFVDAGSWYEERRGRNRLHPSAVHRIHALCRERATEEGVSSLVQLSEIRAAGYGLNVSEWVGVPEKSSSVDLLQGLRELRDLERERDAAARTLDKLVERFGSMYRRSEAATE